MGKRLTNKQLESAFDEINEFEEIDCEGDIMCKIKAGSVKMRSRWLVLTEYLGIRTSWIILLLLIMALVNLNLYILSRSPELRFLEFGSPGFWAVASNLPYGWWTLAFSCMIIAILIMKQFSFTYASSFTLIASAIVTFVFFSGTAAFATGLNEDLYKKFVEEPGESQTLLAKLLCMCRNRYIQSDNALMGEVMYVNSDGGFILQTPDLSVFSVVVTADTDYTDSDGPLEKYKTVKMLGTRDEDMFYATHVLVDSEEEMQLVRDGEDCEDKEKWQKKQEIAERRRQIVNQPLTPIQGAVQMIMSVH